MAEKKEDIKETITDLLPDNSGLVGEDGMSARDGLVDASAARIVEAKTASEIAKARAALRRSEEVQAAHKAVGEFRKAKAEAQEKAIARLEEENPYPSAVEAIEAGNALAESEGAPTISLASDAAKAIMATQGTTRPEVVRLLTRLGVNLNLQLTKTDTANLLACLLTANETQLNALYHDKKVPVAIRTVIKRILDDSRLGNIETVERLWDRIFGKTGMLLDLPQQGQQATGIIPNTPVSREAYLLLRETYMK